MNLLENFLATITSFGWTLIVVLVIWYVGMWVLNLVLRLVKKLDIKGTKADDKIRKLIASILPPLFKVVLAIVILDYVGIGRSIIDAVLGSISLAVGIALGWAFGEALKPTAKDIVKRISAILN